MVEPPGSQLARKQEFKEFLKRYDAPCDSPLHIEYK